MKLAPLLVLFALTFCACSTGPRLPRGSYAADYARYSQSGGAEAGFKVFIPLDGGYAK